jgi:hypothetical protein
VLVNWTGLLLQIVSGPIKAAVTFTFCSLEISGKKQEQKEKKT